MRYCWLILILYCPLRSPLSASRRLPGGIVSSSKEVIALSWSSFLRAIDQRFGGHSFLAALESLLSKMSSVA